LLSAAYARRDQTRREHLAELTGILGCKIFVRSDLRASINWLSPMAHKPRGPEQLVSMLIDELRRRRILLPSAAVPEMIVHQARGRAERTLHRALVNGLSSSTRASLDRLLEPMPEKTTSRLAWLRSAQQSPAARNFLGLAERARFVRMLGIDRKRRSDIPAQAFERLADEGLRLSVQHLGDLAGPRRHAVLCANVIKLESALTDAALSMFDKLMGSIVRKAARRFDERTLQSAREARARVQSLTMACRAVIAARDNGSDPFVAVERDVGWHEFLRAVAEAETFAAPAVEGNKVGADRKVSERPNVCADAARDVRVPGAHLP
jgi:hypothetical protein